VAIARAIVNNPPILLADEPTGNLDTKTGEEIMHLVQSLNGDGMTIIMVTHNPENARFAHRTIHLKDGRIQSLLDADKRRLNAGYEDVT
jgi:putative ABC transport system ATP-binding protein